MSWKKAVEAVLEGQSRITDGIISTLSGHATILGQYAQAISALDDRLRVLEGRPR